MNREQRRKAARTKMVPKQVDPLTDEEKSALCLQCQECCKHLPISIKYEPQSPMFKEMAEFFVAHGCEAQLILNTYVVSVPHRCQHLTERGCDIYETRPAVCRSYDGRKDPRLFKKCLWGKKKGGMESNAGYSDRANVKLD